ncbi:MAG TPA: hypothetical protein VKJ45_03055 [Blastocatellia bacterium]|nr:hypothetical protein [Blastocatellia bacterium]
MPLTPGFNINEAESLIAMLSALEAIGQPPLPPPLKQPPSPPPSWSIIYDSQSIGPFDNRWQLAEYSNQGTTNYAILVRGTIDAPGSIVDDLLSVMLPANGSLGIDVDGVDLAIDYQFAAPDTMTQSPVAGVHLGFSLSSLIMMYDPDVGILWQLPNFVPQGSSVFIAGHSQGAAIATLMTSFLNYSSNWKLFQQALGYNYANNYKTYVFAQPRPGNDIYGYDYESIASNGGMAFTVNNNQDWVPQVPLTFELPGDINSPNPLSVLSVGELVLVNFASDLRNLVNHLAKTHAVKQAPKVDALRNIMIDERFQKVALKGGEPRPAIPADAGLTLPSILPTLNFAGCGSYYTLAGVPGSNPCVPDDSFWQHHGAMYYDLLEGIPIPSNCD